jgi:Inhibitor of Apoptosis domain
MASRRESRYISIYSGERKDYHLIDIRNESYMFYPQSEIPALFYAEAGFYYTGNDDISRCFRCGLEIHKLRLGQNPFETHRFMSEKCPFVTSLIASNEQHLDASEIDSDNDELNLDSDLDETTTSTMISTSGKIGNLKFCPQLLTTENY